MKSIWLIARRELGATLRSPMGFIVAAMVLATEGLFFNLLATGKLGSGEMYSTTLLSNFFSMGGVLDFSLSGLTIVASIPISMRLLAEEHQKGTFPLLLTSPLRDYQIVTGKFLGAFLFLGLLVLISIYMPLLIMVHGKLSFGHLFSGYLGTLLLAASSLAIGTFGSAVSKNQIVAVFVTTFLLLLLTLMWLLASVVDEPLQEIFRGLAFHNKHVSSFRSGSIHLRDIIYYLSVMSFFLFAATRILESRRWR